jgi:hypothetical protein
VNETVLHSARKTLETNASHASGEPTPEKEGGMRALVFGAILLAVGSVLFHEFISASLVAARDAKAATFSERFAPALKPTSG